MSELQNIFKAFEHGCIFLCNESTKKECLDLMLFGSPSKREAFIERWVTKKCALFLFKMGSRDKEPYMMGVFQAAAKPEMNIVTEAWRGASGGKSLFPMQVRVKYYFKFDNITWNHFQMFVKDGRNGSYHSADKGKQSWMNRIPCEKPIMKKELHRLFAHLLYEQCTKLPKGSPDWQYCIKMGKSLENSKRSQGLISKVTVLNTSKPVPVGSSKMPRMSWAASAKSKPAAEEKDTPKFKILQRAAGGGVGAPKNVAHNAHNTGTSNGSAVSGTSVAVPPPPPNFRIASRPKGVGGMINPPPPPPRKQGLERQGRNRERAAVLNAHGLGGGRGGGPMGHAQSSEHAGSHGSHAGNAQGSHVYQQRAIYAQQQAAYQATGGQSYYTTHMAQGQPLSPHRQPQNPGLVAQAQRQIESVSYQMSPGANANTGGLSQAQPTYGAAQAQYGAAQAQYGAAQAQAYSRPQTPAGYHAQTSRYSFPFKAQQHGVPEATTRFASQGAGVMTTPNRPRTNAMYQAWGAQAGHQEASPRDVYAAVDQSRRMSVTSLYSQDLNGPQQHLALNSYMMSPGANANTGGLSQAQPTGVARRHPPPVSPHHQGGVPRALEARFQQGMGVGLGMHYQYDQ